MLVEFIRAQIHCLLPMCNTSPRLPVDASNYIAWCIRFFGSHINSPMHDLAMTQQVKLDACQCSRHLKTLHTANPPLSTPDHAQQHMLVLAHHELESVVAISLCCF